MMNTESCIYGRKRDSRMLQHGRSHHVRYSRLMQLTNSDLTFTLKVYTVDLCPNNDFLVLDGFKNKRSNAVHIIFVHVLNRKFSDANIVAAQV